MSSENLQTIIVSKKAAKTRHEAEKLARPHANRIYTSRETGSSWRFRQRSPEDFIKNSFKSFILPENPDIVLVYGRLKRSKNPGNQSWLQYGSYGDEEQISREWDFWMGLSYKIMKAKDIDDLKSIIESAENYNIKTPLIEGLVINSIADRARKLRITKISPSAYNDLRIYNIIKGKKEGKLFANPSNRKYKNKKVKKSKKHIKLKSPKIMPDPGPCAWLGSIIEWGWAMKKGESSSKVDDKGNAIWEPSSEWMFLWSPKYKAVVAVRRPKNMYRMANVSRYGGAAKMFERFMARSAENTFEIQVPEVPISKLGKSASHIVYRSDKWSAQRLNSDYIHSFGSGVQIYCGPNAKNPEVFICFGGKLTLTERGLVW